VTAGIEVIQSVEYEIKHRKPVDIELAVLDVGMIGF
jgi:hypothetical protein